ncbi:MAG: hypothetical protein ACTSWN_15360 [Promethearchaeota archaeon]
MPWIQEICLFSRMVVFAIKFILVGESSGHVVYFKDCFHLVLENILIVEVPSIWIENGNVLGNQQEEKNEL